MKKLIEDCVKEEGKHEEIRKWEIYEQVEGYKRQWTITAYEEFSIVSRIKNKHTLIYNKDIIGAEIKDEENDSCKIEISAMPIIDFKEKIRELYTYTYWVNSIKKAKDIVGTFIDISLGNPILDEYKDLPPKTKHLLILINPFSCSGQAVKNWNVVYPMISKFHLNFKVLTTEYSGHAKEIWANENISLFTSIVTVSGDGLIHEVVNGLMQRKDKLEPLPLVGVLPGGTSDGLVKTILFEWGEGFSLTNAVYVVGKGKEKKIDLFKIKAEQNDTLIYSFLGLSWAICSDIDLESEVIRIWCPIKLIRIFLYYNL